jgi:hypothetical protein
VSGYFFYLQTYEASALKKIVIAVDHRGIGELIASFWRLLNGETTILRVSTLPEFSGINMSEIGLVRDPPSKATFDGDHLEIEINQSKLQRYAELLEELLRHGHGHQYLDANSRNIEIEILVSIGEYSPAFIERIRRGASRGH